MVRKPELLIPASSLEVLKIAVMFGADAVYIGGEAFGLRAKAKNFSTKCCGAEKPRPPYLRKSQKFRKKNTGKGRESR